MGCSQKSLSTDEKKKKEVKAIQSEIKKNIQGTDREGKKTRTQIKDLEQKEEISIQQEHNEEIRIKKYKDSIRTLCDIFKHTNI